MDVDTRTQALEDPGFADLHPSLQRRIDSAFDRLHGDQEESRERPTKYRKLNHAPADPQGGFILEEAGGFELPAAGGFVIEDDMAAGGFVVEDPPLDNHNTTSNPLEDQIPISLIPAGLASLSLPPDDEQVLAVFENAASGWSSGTSNKRPADSDVATDKYVTRRDWHAVCAVLMEGEQVEDGEPDSHASPTTAPPEDQRQQPSLRRSARNRTSKPAPIHDGDESDLTEEEYQEEPDSDDGAKSNSSDDEYGADAPSPAKRRTRGTRAAKAAASASDDDDDDLAPRTLTARQKAECRRAFALFFDSDEGLDERRLMIKDIDKVAKVLKEKISAEEIVDMLKMFSTSSDHAMSITDFEHMMVATKLVQ